MSRKEPIVRCVDAGVGIPLGASVTAAPVVHRPLAMGLRSTCHNTDNVARLARSPLT